MDIREKLREEIMLRLERETRYIIELANHYGKPYSLEAVNLLTDKLKQNDMNIKLISDFLFTTTNAESTDTSWEKFYRERYWDKK